MEKGSLEIFKSPYGYYNFRISDGKPGEELVTYLKENGYRWSRNNNCWYPATSGAKEANLHNDFVARFQEKFSALQTGEQEKKSFAQDLIDRENRKEEWRKNHEGTEKTAQLESLIAELREELRRDKEKITQLESELSQRHAAENRQVSVENERNAIEIKPVSLEEILSVMEMKPEMTPDGKIRVFDQQRGEYIDNREDFEKYGGLSFDFDNAEEIFERLDTYINDYFVHDMEEQLEAGGVTLRGDETLEICAIMQKLSLRRVS